MNFTERVKDFILKHKLISPKDTILVGVSGGPDSMALLFVLSSLKEELDFSIIVCCVDHKLRPESREEAIFVSKTSRKLGLPFVLKELDIDRMKKRGSLEEIARVARYKALEEARIESNSNKIAVAHHLDDQVETVIMRIIRGTSIKGLRGIPIKNRNIIRPLMCVWRQEILDFCRENSISYVIDSSNLSIDFTRNKIRLELLPKLTEYNPRVKESILRIAIQAEELDQFLSYLESNFLERYRISDQEFYIPIEEISPLPSLLRRRILMKILIDTSPKPNEVREESYKMLEYLLESSTGTKLNLPGGSIAYRNHNGIRILREEIESLPVYELNVPGITIIDRLNKKVFTEITENGRYLKEKLSNNLYTFYLDFDKIKLPIYLRSPKEGEKFSPLGLRGRNKKLQDIMVDRKIPREYRGLYPIIVDSNGEIICIPEYTISEKVKVTDNTKRILIVRIEDYE
ncbi:MAG: tRNA lysidine(34) synthetase TilS [bacterium]|nr:tRNA lysidine(34) synthetase TilS [bacterium]